MCLPPGPWQVPRPCADAGVRGLRARPCGVRLYPSPASDLSEWQLTQVSCPTKAAPTWPAADGACDGGAGATGAAGASDARPSDCAPIVTIRNTNDALNN